MLGESVHWRFLFSVYGRYIKYHILHFECACRLMRCHFSSYTFQCTHSYSLLFHRFTSSHNGKSCAAEIRRFRRIRFEHNENELNNSTAATHKEYNRNVYAHQWLRIKVSLFSSHHFTQRGGPDNFVPDLCMEFDLFKFQMTLSQLRYYILLQFVLNRNSDQSMTPASSIHRKIMQLGYTIQYTLYIRNRYLCL